MSTDNVFNDNNYSIFPAVKYAQNNRDSYSIMINLNNHQLTLFKDSNVYKTYPVAVGKPSTPTPRGTFKIKNKSVNPGGPFGARWMGLTVPKGSYGIHGTNDPSSIGKSISHGCVRMYNKDVIELFNLVPIGTTVRII
jgi:lipoprotein-anchoring transpeptidase ErfK/SrfK